MARKPVIDLAAWPSLALEGNLIAPAMVAQIAEPKDDTKARETYGIRKGLTFRDEISTAFRVAQSHFDAFAKLQNPSVETTRRFARDLLKEAFGFDDLVAGDGAVSFIAGGRTPIVVVPPTDEKLDRRSAALSVERTRSPAMALQDCLNEHDDMLWGLVTNGLVLRLMRDNASLTRPAYIEADLAQIFTNEDAASFAALWALIHRTRFGVAGALPTDCPLERWREEGAKEGEAARDRLAGQVELALKALGSGFLEANPDLAARLKSGEINLTDWFNELLRLVYRLIFLMVAEDRNLLHPGSATPEARKLYAEGYSLAMLRAQCVRRAAWDRHSDRYEGVKIVFRALARGEKALGLPALGGLFAADRLPHLENVRLRNKAFMEALYRLAWLSDKSGTVPVNWRAMKTEELGSVYESLLELQPQLGADGKTLVFASDAAEQKGNQRKTTGSYYTPDSLVQALLDTALDPVLDQTEAEAADSAAALLKLSVIDPACGSGHFLLAAASRIATRLARIRADGAPSLADFRHALRDVARSCIHGVDRNPMAVELTKVALWIETVDPGLPLGFFDAQIRCGDALLGVFDLKALEQGIPDAAYKALTGDDKEAAKTASRVNRNQRETKKQRTLNLAQGMADLARTAEALDAMPEDDLAGVEARANAFRASQSGAGWRNTKTACDLYVAAFLTPKQFRVESMTAAKALDRIPTTVDVAGALSRMPADHQVLARAVDVAGSARAFHWPLEFPDVMARGGFDVVLGNPPWERIKVQEQEFFAARSADIANAPNKAAREKLIKVLATAPAGSADRALFDAFTAAKRDAEATSEFVRVPGEVGGRFALTGRGDVNTYALFAELMSCLKNNFGRTGAIIPTGVATDDSLKHFFQSLVRSKRLHCLYSFDEIRRWFQGTDDRKPFCLLTLGTSSSNMHFMFGIEKISDLSDERRCVVLSVEDIAGINPNTLTAPVFRSRADAELTAKLYRNAPVLMDEAKDAAGNPWGVTFMAMFHMSNDSALFRTAAQLSADGFARDATDWVRIGAGPTLALTGGRSGRELALQGGGPRELTRYVPLYEAKMFHQFEHRFGTAENMWERPTNAPWPRAEPAQLGKSTFEPEPWYWIPSRDVADKLDANSFSKAWHINWRRGARNGDERTIIVSVLNSHLGVGDNAFTILVHDPQFPIHGLLCNLNSLVLDFSARQKVSGSNISYYLLKQLPVLPPIFYTEPRLAFITPRVLELTYTSHSLAPFARDLGHNGPPFPWDENRRAQLRADLDAFYARAYGLTRDELRYILDPADVKGADYPSETFRVLKEKEIKQHGEYRTRRLVLEAWDRMEADGTFAALALGGADAAVTTRPIRLPSLGQIPDGVWAWAHGVDERDRVRAQLRAMAGILPEGADARRARLATLACLNPSLLSGFLSEQDRAEWQRIVGPQARVLQSVATLTPPTNAAWGAAYNELVTADVLNISADGTEWSAGPRLDRSALHIDDPAVGRALFAWSRLQSVDLDQGLTRLSAEIIPFIREGRLAA